MCVCAQTVKRPRRVALHTLERGPSPDQGGQDYGPPTHYYDADRDDGWCHDDGHNISDKRYMESEHRVGRDYDQKGRSRGQSQERTTPSPSRAQREGSRGAEHYRYHSQGRSPGGRHTPDDRYERGDGGGRSHLHGNRPSKEPSRDLEPLDTPVNVLLVKNRPTEGLSHTHMHIYT